MSRVSEAVGINFEAIPLVESESEWTSFRQNGWIVIKGSAPNVGITAENAKAWLDNLRDWIMSYSNAPGKLLSFQEGGFTDIHQFWTAEDIPASTRDSGYITEYVSHSEFMWTARMMVKNLFADTWKNDYLFTSFEGATYAVDGNRFVASASREHISMEQDGRGDRCLGIQGMISLVDVTHPQAGGIFVVNQSHSDFVRLSDSTVSLKDIAGQLVRPIMRAGDVLLTDTRLLKGSVRPRYSEDFHEAFASLWVTMMPRIKISEQDLRKRIEFFYNQVTTGPWCYHFKLDKLPPQSTIGSFIAKDPRGRLVSYGRLATKTDFTREQIELVAGLSPEDTEKLRQSLMTTKP
jgi:hypothetical protein